MKKLIAVAVLSAFAAPAFADSGNVTISGDLRGGFQHYNDTLGGGASQNKIDGRANITFAGTEDLGNGLSTVWGVTTRTMPDGVGDDNGSSKTNGIVGGKEAYLGLKGNFGQIRLGHDLDNFNDGKHSGFVVYGGEGFGSVAADTNAARYDLPAMGNFTASVRVNLGENKTTGHGADTGYVLRADYDTETWDIGGAYARQTDKASDDKVTTYNLTGAYRLGNGLELAGEYQRTKVASDDAATKEYMLYVNYTTGKIGVGGEYGRIKHDTDKVKLYGLYANYSLSKRTKAFTEYQSTKADGGDRATRFYVGLKHTF